MSKIKAINYEEARSEYFKKQMKKAGSSMEDWARRSKFAQITELRDAYHDKASDAGWKYNFYKDALEALDVKDDFFGAVLNCAVRYCLGRTSYMPGLVIDYITPMLPRLTKKTLWCFECDIEGCENYGMDMDKEKWMEFLAKVKEAIANAENA